VALVVLISVMIPLAISAAIVLLIKVALTAGRTAFLTVATVLAGTFWLNIVEDWGIDSPSIAVVIALVIGLATVALFIFSRVIRGVVTALGAIAPVAVIVVFSLISPANGLILPSPESRASESASIENPAPIVLIVLDELPVASLVDAEGSLLSDIYPNFGRLAERSVWFRNAVTVESNTHRSIPAMLSGRTSEADSLPIQADYPHTLFTLLADSYEIWAIEPVTELCPSACHADPSSRQVSWDTITSDLMIVSLHLTLPRGWTGGLPPIDESWADFVVEPDSSTIADSESDFNLDDKFNSLLDEGRMKDFEEFLSGLNEAAGSSQPTLNFIHLLLPHSPWEYLPDGRLHGAPVPPAGKVGSGWGDNPWLVKQAYQQHLLQTQFVDHLVGRVIDQLQELDMFDDSLIVLLADHGVIMRPGVERRRGVTPDSIGEIAPVPLFIKLPGSLQSGIDDYRAHLTDVLPTIADVIDAEVDWDVSGASLLSGDRPIRTVSTLNSGRVEFGVDGQEMLDVASRRMQIFPEGDPFQLAANGHSELLGMKESDLAVVGTAQFMATIPDLAQYRSVDLEAAAIPAHLSGTISAVADLPATLAIVVNGAIGAVTESYSSDGADRFQAMLPPNLLQSSNTIEVLSVENGSSGIMFRLVPISR